MSHNSVRALLSVKFDREELIALKVGDGGIYPERSQTAVTRCNLF